MQTQNKNKPLSYPAAPPDSQPTPLLQALPPITANTALFLDFDGTLVEIAAQPEDVQIPPNLLATLAALHDRLGGALALVSGRRLSDIDGFLTPLRFPAAAEHGAQRRGADQQLSSFPAPCLQQARLAAEGLLVRHPGLRLEQKHLALTLHYRHAPELEGLCLQVMRAAVERSVGLDLMQGKCVLDVRPSGVSKGTAIAAFMSEAPFAGRLPVFAGDDTTDEDGFEQVQRLGGHAIKVGGGPSVARHRCDSVTALAAWLQLPLAVQPDARAEKVQA